MPQAVTHILVPILIVALFRDFYLRNKDKKHFPLHYVLFAGLGGVLPDIDIPISFILAFIGSDNWNIHKTFTHSLFFPLVFFILFLFFMHTHSKAKICNLGRHRLKLSIIFLMSSIGILFHILLDSIFGESAFFFYPLSMANYGIDILSFLPQSVIPWAIPTLDGILLVIWIVYLELKHKISDFI
ncbi:hypothetical protein CO038_01405 [Candidatus Pacearchaeota archaeon CG_4_9_14_0_2_um_filter_39_13]|nr:metal-dependent hydrolase [Candidatus Pacearchaeota archaeon]PJC44865.1 MAG: hypothetical protein CO038_01405 [Candidatus Pacearchaeota archaeon CG_4_9_14_0_2_um_filter_39_13]